MVKDQDLGREVAGKNVGSEDKGSRGSRSTGIFTTEIERQHENH